MTKVFMMNVKDGELNQKVIKCIYINQQLYTCRLVIISVIFIFLY